MSDLLARVRLAVPENRTHLGVQENMAADYQFVEAVTFADPDELLAVLRQVIAENWIGLPPWARNLAYRMACLHRPDDAELLREAAHDLLAFGPDWDEDAEELLRRADLLDPRP
ncbi:hypothetical protein ACFW9N_45910 [Streptomyces sp. NPDC059496]|uniref:hypothetical protein n=1 Tax=Streptomyces sp. NPDC059496 TaxID=3346851 RepID=UPI0036AF95AD